MSMKQAVQHLHFVGIGGAGMSAIAELMHLQGYRVSGSDLHDSATTRRLQGLGVHVFIGHQPDQVLGADAVVTSSAVAATNPEVQAARSLRMPVVARAVLLAELMRNKQGIAIAGTHGKTTTSALVASVLMDAGADPSFVIGGTLAATGSNAHLGQGDSMVVEADESDASFLHLSPAFAVVTNIDADHMETYGHDLQVLHTAFVDFVHRLPFYGRAVLCTDDPGVRAILSQLERPLRSYGLNPGADLQATEVRALPGGGMRFVAQQAGHDDLPVQLNLSGQHNVRNALAALAVSRELGLADADAVRALAQFAGVGRRFSRHGEMPVPAASGGGSFTLVDDYGHHPTEMAAVLAAARGAFPGRRLLLAFQPHRYTRTRDCLADFVAVMSGFDAVLLTEVYAAGEDPIEGATGADLALALDQAGAVSPLFADDVETLPETLLGLVRNGDVLITLGAGSISGVAGRLVHLTRTAT